MITHYRNVSLIRVNGLVSKATSTYCIQCQEAWMVHCTNVTISVHIFCKKCSWVEIWVILWFTYQRFNNWHVSWKISKKMKVQLLVVSLRLVYRNDFGACHGAPNSSISRSKSLLVTSSSKGVRRLFILQDPSKSLHSILWETALYVETPGQVPMISVLWKKKKGKDSLWSVYTKD